jgi:hypothetical protein
MPVTEERRKKHLGDKREEREERRGREEREENRYEYHCIESTVDPQSQLLLLTHIVDSNCEIQTNCTSVDAISTIVNAVSFEPLARPCRHRAHTTARPIRV